MAERATCSNGWGKSKVCYKTRAAAEKAARRSPAGLRLYLHRDCGSWHLTHEEPRHKPEPIPSASKLRRKLENAGREIAAAEKRLSTAERAYFEELAYVHRETERIMAGRVR